MTFTCAINSSMWATFVVCEDRFPVIRQKLIQRPYIAIGWEKKFRLTEVRRHPALDAWGFNKLGAEGSGSTELNTYIWITVPPKWAPRGSLSSADSPAGWRFWRWQQDMLKKEPWQNCGCEGLIITHRLWRKLHNSSLDRIYPLPQEKETMVNWWARL